MLELGAGADILRAFVWLYWGGLFLAVVLVLRFVKNGYAKLIGLLVVLGLFLSPVLLREWEVRRERDAFLTRQRVGQAHFQERCKTAGEKITRTVENVDGILLMKLRPETVDYDGQFTPDDVYGHDSGGRDYIMSFLRLTRGTEYLDRVPKESRPRYAVGYGWVEAQDPKDGQIYRYTLAYKAVRKRSAADWELAKKNEPGIGEDVLDFALERQLIERPSARYGLTWDEISTRDDREQWVAGGVLNVIDLQSNEVIAERRGYMWDYGMGSRSGGRAPWGFARDRSCPEFRLTSDRRAYFDPVSAQFTQSVLQPTIEER